MVVDEVRGVVVLRVGFWMEGKGVGEGGVVENDLVWVLEMSEGDSGEGWKVNRSVEFVDGMAVGRLKEVVMGEKMGA